MKKHYAFGKELNVINKYDAIIGAYTQDMIDLLPDYIFEVGASSTGKYHPSYTIGDGGLVKHKRGAMGVAIEMFNNQIICETFGITSDYDKACILSALALHDGMKSGTQEDYGKSKYTKHEHPLLMVRFLMNNFKDGESQINKETLKVICKLIASHMGQWNTNPKSSVVLPKPETPLEKFVHLCDYLASRKALEFNFNATTY